jgi:hypothetical protein
LYINTLIIGYLLGRYTSNNGVQNIQTSFLKKNISNSHQSVSIDDKKFVVDINTDNLEKKYNSLGEIKNTTDDISNSIDKLKNLKR